MKLPRRQKYALNFLMGLGIITAITCIIRTAFSYEVKADDQTWEGIPNALCRMLEINFGIIAACMPMMRPLWNWSKRKWRERFGPTKVTTVRTPMSRLQWYRAPEKEPWYKRLRRYFQWAPRPPISQTSSTQSMNPSRAYNENNNSNNEKAVTKQSRSAAPIIPRPTPRSKPSNQERPANATWAKDSGTPSNSIDLPLQGVRSSEWVEDRHPDGGKYNFHKHKERV